MSAAAREQSSEGSGNRLRTLVAALVCIEALAVLGGAVFLLVAVVTSRQDSPAGLIGLAAVAAVFGAGLAICGRGVFRGLHWTRGPVLTWQLLQAGIAMPLSTSGSWWLGVPLLAVSVVVGVLIVGPYAVARNPRRF